MGLLTLEQSPLAYCADFALYGTAVVGLSVFLFAGEPSGLALVAAGWMIAGVVAWTIVEYAVHRFVLHHVQPFRGWHEAHHRRPVALICAPTLLTGSLIFGLMFLPAWGLLGLWHACALTLGLLIGYFVYAVTHHATHHWRADNRWLRRRKLWHSQHHYASEPGRFGVTSSFWDHAFGSVGTRRG